MKSYLDLIPVSAKLHRKQTRMTRLCIAISVFLVAAIFGMADMFLQGQKNQAIQSDGGWHAVFKGLEEEEISLIRARPEVQAGTRYAVTNYRLDMGYRIQGTQTVLCGFDESFLELFPGIHLVEGTFPQGKEEALVTESVRKRLGLEVGDPVEIGTPDETLTFRVSGWVEDTSDLLKNGAFGVFLNTDAYFACFRDATLEEDVVFYMAFKPHVRIQKALEEIQEQFHIPEDAVSENAKLLGVLLQSSDNYILRLYFMAVILAMLVAFSGILMIMGSLNSNVAQRTEFFGMMSCLGATERQIRRFVRREALSWCRTAIPSGLACGTVAVWILCRTLRAVSPVYFGAVPGNGISWPGIVSGFGIGLLTVLAASMAPAKKASKVSPLTAVSGNADTVFAVKRAANTGFFPIESALGIHHAAGSKKNLFLLTASFAFSILLFLSFSTGIDFMKHALTPLRPYTPDISIVSRENGCDIPDSLLEKLKEQKAVKRIFGRSFAYGLAAEIRGERKTVNLISYEDYQFGWASEDLEEGSMEKVRNGEGVLLVKEDGFSAEIHEEIGLETALGPQSAEVAGILSYAPFDGGEGVGTLICSERLFRCLTGASGYTILDIQLSDLSDETVDKLYEIAGNGYTFSDQRTGNMEVKAVYYSFALLVYGFLAIVALIAAFNIINSIGMSVSARMRQYGAMRAIGTSVRQLKIMIVSETAAYLLSGLAAGTVFGVPLHWFLYSQAITSRWGDAWRIPVPEFCVIGAVMIVSAAAAAAAPMRWIDRMSVAETISAQ